jgi:hypothetical protein
MAVLTPSPFPVRFEAGGEIIINDGTDSVTLILTEEGSVRESYGLEQPITYWDRTVPKTPLRGRQNYSRIGMAFKYASDATSDDIRGFLTDFNTGEANPKTFSITIKRFDNVDDATGVSHAWATCFLNGDSGLEIQAGGEHDIIRCEFMSPDPKPVEARF